MNIQVDGAVKDAVVTMQIDGSHADVQFFRNCVCDGVIYTKTVPAAELDPGQVGEDLMLGPAGSDQPVSASWLCCHRSAIRHGHRAGAQAQGAIPEEPRTRA